MVHGPARALVEIAAIEASGALAGHHAVAAAKADLLRRLGRVDEARVAYDTAIASARNEVERRFLSRRRNAL